MGEHPDAPTGARRPVVPDHGLGAAVRDSEFSVADAVGGPRGIAESVAPTLLFVVLFTATRSITAASIAALAACAVAILVRLVQRQRVGSAVGGLLGVAIGAFWAMRSGSGSDFYLPGIITNAVSLAVLLVSLVARRPLVGLLVGVLDPRVARWAESTDARRTYARATWVLAALFAARTIAETALYLAHAIAALGTVKLVMGLPLFALAVWIIWGMHRALLHRVGTDLAASRAPDEASARETSR